MAYNPYSAVEKIYNLKKQWADANAAGDENTKKDAAAKAQAYYTQLKDNGYADVADALTASNYTQAKAIHDKWAKMGKTSANEYLYSLGGSKGLSQNDVDKLISMDGQTGELSFGGKKIGAPDSVVDGTAYLADTSVLDNAFNDYINRAGVTVSDSKLSSINSAEVKDKINDLWGTQQGDRKMMTDKYSNLEGYIYDHNPYESEIGKSIMEDYKWQGKQASENEVASGAGSNGGNIDSFAAANASRQQMAFTNAGKQAVLNDFNARIANVRNTLSDMGVYLQNQDVGMQNTIQIQQNEAQRLFDNDQTAKDKEVKRKSDIAAVTGYAPDEWTVSNNPYMNDDGTIKDEYKNIDFSAVMANAKAAGNTEAYNAAAVARYYKIMGDYGAYGQYDDGNYAVPGLKKTEAARQFDENTALSDRALTSKQNEAALDRQHDLDLIKAETEAQKDLLAEQAKYPELFSDKTGDGDDGDDGDGDSEGEKIDWDTFMSYFPEKDNGDKDVRSFLNEQLKPYYDNGWRIDEAVLEKLICGNDVENSNSTKYDIDVIEARAICNALNLDDSWLDAYEDRWGFNHRKGMKLKK